MYQVINTFTIVPPLSFFLSVLQLRQSSGSAITENGELQPDDLVTKDFPSELNSNYAEDSNVSSPTFLVIINISTAEDSKKLEQNKMLCGKCTRM